MDVSLYVMSQATAMSQAKLDSAVSVAVMKKAMDTQEAQGMALVQMLNSVPDMSRLVDTYA